MLDENMQRVVETQRLGYVASVCGPVLLADPGADFDWTRIV